MHPPLLSRRLLHRDNNGQRLEYFDGDSFSQVVLVRNGAEPEEASAPRTKEPLRVRYTVVNSCGRHAAVGSLRFGTVAIRCEGLRGTATSSRVITSCTARMKERG